MQKNEETKRPTVFGKPLRDWGALCNALFVLWWIQGIWFFVFSFAFCGGGGALEGKIQNGHYFVAKGSFTEVSKTVYWFGYGLEVVWIALFVLFAASYLLVAVQTGDMRWLEAEWHQAKNKKATLPKK